MYKLNSIPKTAITAALLLIISSLVLVQVSLSHLKNDVLTEYEKSLNTVLNTSTSAIGIWANQKTSILNDVSKSELMTELINQLVEPQNRQLNGYEDLDRSIERYLAGKSIENLFIVNQNSEVIYALYRPQSAAKIWYQFSLQYPALISSGVATQFLPPVKGSLSSDEVFKYAGFLQAFDFEDKRYQLVALVKPETELSEIVKLGRIGESGETYLFDKDGYMTTDSRFKEQLVRFDLLDENTDAVLNIKLYDPKVNIYLQPEAPRSQNELTKMAVSAIQGNKTFDVKGYNDYRGIKVIGAWQWIEPLHMGITTEVDLEEALSSYRSSRTILLSLLALSLSLALLLGLFVVRVSYDSTKKLRIAANELEDKVDERTHALADALGELSNEKAVIQSLFDNIPDPIFCKDHERRYIKGNVAFYDAFGKTAAEVLGHTDEELTHQKDVEAFRNSDLQVLKTGEPVVFERVASNAKEKQQIYLTRKFKIDFPNDQPPGILCIAQDITEQRATEKSLIQATLAAQSASKAKSEFLARMSHEIRTPMNGVIGMLDLLRDSNISSQQHQQVEIAKSSADSLLGVINDILDFSRVEAGKLELDIVDFDPIKLIDDSIKALAVKADAKGIELLLDTTKIEYGFVKGDPLRLRQILTNLLNNALKFTEHGQVVISANIIKQKSTLLLKCQIQDTGIGIEEEKVPVLFESFSQVDSSTTRTYGGSGLGLAICKRLCELMDGDIWVKSKLGSGSTFGFEIRLEESDVEPQEQPTLDIKDLAVLVVDDNPINLEIIQKQLNLIGLKSTLCSSVDQALVQLNETHSNDKKQHFDIVITDMNMPHRDGLELAKEIRTQSKFANIKIIMLSSMTFTMDRLELKARGLDASLLKPVVTEDLYNTLALVTKQQNFDELINEQNLLQYRHTTQAKFQASEHHLVLVVEDNAVNMLVAEGLLKKLNLHFKKAFNGQECLELLKKQDKDHPFTVILMDCQMPVMDGYTATAKIRAGTAGDEYKDIPIIAMTANALKGDKEKCFTYGMTGYVSKPIALKTLSEQLLIALDETAINPSMDVGDAQNVLDNLKLNIPFQDLRTMDWINFTPSLHQAPDLYLKSLRLFMSENTDISLKLGISHDEQEILRQQIHTLKGSAGNMGFYSLYKLCLSLESKIKEQGLKTSDLKVLKSTLQDSFYDAEIILSQNAVEDYQEKSTRNIRALYSEIYKFTENSEWVPTELIDETHAIATNLPQEDKIHAIIGALERFDYEAVNKLLADEI
jgi:PAS domain S-box-containing protein